MDSLSELVRLLAPSGTVDLHCRVAGAWSAHHEQAPPGHVPYHVILDGQADLAVGEQRLQVKAGDVLLFPHGAAHTLSAQSMQSRQSPQAGQPDGRRRFTESRHFNGVVTEVSVPGALAPLDILCGTFVLGSSAAILLRAMPEMLCVGTDSGDASRGDDAGWLRGLIGMMHTEASAAGPGSAAIIANLSTALFTVLLRTLLVQALCRTA